MSRHAQTAKHQHQFLICTIAEFYAFFRASKISVVVLEESPCPRGFLRTNFQVLVLVLVLGAQVLVFVLEIQVLVLVLFLGSSSPRKFPRIE